MGNFNGSLKFCQSWSVFWGWFNCIWLFASFVLTVVIILKTLLFEREGRLVLYWIFSCGTYNPMLNVVMNVTAYFCKWQLLSLKKMKMWLLIPICRFSTTQEMQFEINQSIFINPVAWKLSEWTREVELYFSIRAWIKKKGKTKLGWFWNAPYMRHNAIRARKL